MENDRAPKPSPAPAAAGNTGRADGALPRIAERIAARYAEDRRLLAFDGALSLFLEDPYLATRSSVQYLRDAIRHFGTTDVPWIGGTIRRWRVFDVAWDRGTEGGGGAVAGHEEAQNQIVEVIEAAAREGRLDRMIVLHGPNGSGKSSLLECLQRGLEKYSHAPEGAMYALRWIFPKGPPESAGLGFGGGGRREPADDEGSYALLPADVVAGRVVCELRCNPLYVIPDSERPALLASALAACPSRRAESFRMFLRGNLCPKCKAIYEGLLASYRGDWRRVVRHVQAERVFVSRRFRVGAVVVQPQGTVDAALQPVSGGGIAAGLPAFIHATPLFDVLGDLPDANRGMLEFSDFLKRSLELGKYLLQTTERGFVTVGNQLIEIDCVFTATVNERHLEAFRATPEFPSFQGRMHFIRVPYLRELAKEVSIYGDLCRDIARGRHVAPHVAETLASFAVLTRLERPQREHFEGRVRGLVHDLTPAEKLRLYSEGRAPERFDAEDAREIVRVLAELRDEHRYEAQYEGRIGASVRDLRAALLRASVRNEKGCLFPSAVLDALGDLIQERDTHHFLQASPDGDYHDADALLRAAREDLIARITDDIQSALDLVSGADSDRRFEQYVQAVIAQVRGELVRDPATGRAAEPDRALLESVETALAVKGPVAAFRSQLVSRLGAWAVDHPEDRPPDLRRVFPDLVRTVRTAFYEARRDVITKAQRHLVVLGTPDEAALADADRRVARKALENLIARHGYCAVCARDAVGFALASAPR